MTQRVKRGPTLAAFLKTLDHRRNEASLSHFTGITLVDVHLNWLSRFHFLALAGGSLVILKDCIIFLSPLLDVIRMFLSTFSFLAQPEFGIICLENGFLL